MRLLGGTRRGPPLHQPYIPIFGIHMGSWVNDNMVRSLGGREIGYGTTIRARTVKERRLHETDGELTQTVSESPNVEVLIPLD